MQTWIKRISYATFRDADLSGAKINDARAPYADFRGADLRGAYLWGSDFRDSKFCGADLSGANLMCAQLVHADFTDANLTGCKVFGTAVWEVTLTGARQDSLFISSPSEIDEGEIFEVESLQEAQFMQLLHRDKFRPVLDAITKRSVLLLARFGGGGIELLRAVAGRLRELARISHR